MNNTTAHFLQKRGTGICMVLILLALGMASPLFFAPSNLMDILKQGGILTLLVMGLTVALIPGGFDMGRARRCSSPATSPRG